MKAYKWLLVLLIGMICSTSFGETADDTTDQQGIALQYDIGDVQALPVSRITLEESKTYLSHSSDVGWHFEDEILSKEFYLNKPLGKIHKYSKRNYRTARDGLRKA